jgi:hypothetical protein
MTPDSLKWMLDHAASAYDAELREIDKVKERISFVLSVAITPFAAIAVYMASGLKGELFSPLNLYLF